jgi:hypothetical protein
MLSLQMVARCLLLLCMALAPAARTMRTCPRPLPGQKTRAPKVTPKLPEQPPIELRVSGPAIIHRSDRVEFKAMLINHGSAGVLVSPAERSHAFVLSSWWDATDASGAPLDHESIGYCPVDGADYSHKWRLTDSSIRVLKPGEMTEVRLTFPDPRDPLKFRKKGTYQLTLHYFFNPPGRAPDTKDGELVLTNYETSSLSPANILALRKATGLSLTSKAFTIVLE